jgi:purine-binding chemotaxis protein CheW
MNLIKKAPEKAKKPIDWREIERRLETARVVIGRILTPKDEDTRRILQQRARQLAQETLTTEAADSAMEVVEFTLAHERYAVASEYVREVYPLDDITPLPCTPSYVLGIINLHSEILSVIDIKRFFDLPEKGLTDLNKVIVLEYEDMVFGIVADVINGVRHIPRAGIQPSLPTLTGIRSDYLQGVTAERVVILDAVRLLTDKNLYVQEEVG